MIKYDKMFELMKKKGVTSYYLLRSPDNENKIGGATYNKLQKNMPVSTDTLDKMCLILDCQPGDITEYVADKNE